MSKALVALAACGGAPAAFDAAPPPAYSQTAMLLPPLPMDSAAFGSAIASSGDGTEIAVAEVGVVANGASPIGEVFVFPRKGATFQSPRSLQGDYPAPGDKFGASVAIDAIGNTVAVGACGQASGTADESDRSAPHAGAVYVFRRGVDGQLALTGFLKSSVAQASDYLCALAIAGDGNTIAAAAVNENGAAGAVYVFEYNGVLWSQRARLLAPGAQASDRFGAALALSADGATLVAGLPGRASALIYDRSGEDWTLRTTLTGSAGFGESLALSGLATTLVVGAPQLNGSGGATIYNLPDGAMTLVAGTSGTFGGAVAVSRDGRIVAISGTGVPGVLVHPDGSAIDAPAFTGTVALSADGSTLATGAIGDHGGTGEAYVHY